MQKRPADDSDAGRRRNTKNITNLSHHFHDWMVEWLVYDLNTLCPAQGSMVSYATVPDWPTSARLTGLIRSRNSAYMGLNQQPQGYQPMLHPLHQAGGVCRVKTTLYIIQAARHCCSRTGCPLRSGLRWKRSKKNQSQKFTLRCFSRSKWIKLKMRNK